MLIIIWPRGIIKTLISTFNKKMMSKKLPRRKMRWVLLLFLVGGMEQWKGMHFFFFFFSIALFLLLPPSNPSHFLTLFFLTFIYFLFLTCFFLLLTPRSYPNPPSPPSPLSSKPLFFFLNPSLSSLNPTFLLLAPPPPLKRKF